MKKGFLSASGICSGVSILGSYQLCHNLCIGVVALLTFFGIAISGMPLLFLTKVAVPFWIAGIILFGISILLLKAKMNMSKRLLMVNAGLLTAGYPFAAQATPFWIIGGLLVVVGLLWRRRR